MPVDASILSLPLNSLSFRVDEVTNDAAYSDHKIMSLHLSLERSFSPSLGYSLTMVIGSFMTANVQLDKTIIHSAQRNTEPNYGL